MKSKKRSIKRDVMEEVRAVRCLINNVGGDNSEMRLESFMGIFHPEKQADRAFMSRLKNNLSRKAVR